MTTEEVRKGELIIKKYWNELLQYNELTEEDEEPLEIRDFINDPDFMDYTINKNQVQYYFSCGGLHIRIISNLDHKTISSCYTGNEFLEDMIDTFTNEELTPLENLEIIMYMLIERLKKYFDYHNYTPNRWEILKERNFEIAMTIHS